MYQSLFCHCQQLRFASTTLLRGHSLNSSFFLSFSFSLHLSVFPTISPSLLARTHTRTLFRFLSLPTVENARYFHRRANPITSEINRTREPSALRSGPRASERASTSVATMRIRNPVQSRSRSGRAKRFAPTFLSRTTTALTCYPDRARRVLLSSIPLIFFNNLPLFFIAEIAWVLSIAVPFRGCSLVRWRASNDELRSLPTQTLRLSHSFSLVPRAFSPSIAPARFVLRRAFPFRSFSLASARHRSPTFSRRLVLDLAACASGREREESAHRAKNVREKEKDSARGRE